MLYARPYKHKPPPAMPRMCKTEGGGGGVNCIKYSEYLLRFIDGATLSTIVLSLYL